MIQLSNVRKQFGTYTALHSVSLHIKPGEIHGIIGPSGAGKSTLLRMMNLLEVPDQGQVIVNRQDLTKLRGRALRQMRQSIGMIFQGFYLIENKTVYENVSVALEVAKVNKKQQQERVFESLQFVGLEAYKDQYPSQLSGGQKQRVAIARSIVNEPLVLLCDEPTSSLDPYTTQGVLKLLQEINDRLGVTIVLVSHEMEVIQSLCERVTVIQEGSIYDQFKIEPIGISQKDFGASAFVEQLKAGGEKDPT